MRRIDPLWFELSDGCRLAARVWLPDGADEQAVPAILEAVPYRRNDGTFEGDDPRYAWWAEHGLAGVRVDIRGSGDSEGVLLDEYLEREQLDACELIAQIAALPWCNGRVAMLGYSWGGFAALQVAARRPPGLGAIVTVNSTTRRYTDDCHYVGGSVSAHDMLGWATAMLAFQAKPPDPEVVGESWRERWLTRLDASPAFVDAWLSHPLEDGYWRQGSIAFDWSSIDVPVLAVGGLTDPYRNAVLELAEHLPGACEGLLGPWAHGYPHAVTPGPQIAFLADVARFLGQHLRGDPGAPAARLRTFLALPDPPRVETRSGRFVELDAVPQPSLHLTLGNGTLTTGAEQKPLAIPLQTDLRAGRGAGNWCPYSAGVGPLDQGEDDARSACFDGAPLSSPLALVGRPVCELEIAADAPLAQVTARLCAVSPEGASHLLARGTLNLTHREGHDRAVPLTPGVPVRCEIRIDAVSHEVPSGWRLRLALSPSSWPWIWPSPTLVTLTLQGGSLTLPVAPDDAPTVDLGVADAVEPVELEVRAPRAGSATFADEGGQLTQTSRPDYLGGSRLIVPLGIEVAETASATYRIRDDDPLSAEVQNEAGVTLTRAGWSVRIETEATLSCTAERFVATSTLRAYEGSTLVRERTFTSSVPRSGG